jgi:hypothetical protein
MDKRRGLNIVLLLDNLVHRFPALFGGLENLHLPSAFWRKRRWNVLPVFRPRARPVVPHVRVVAGKPAEWEELGVLPVAKCDRPGLVQQQRVDVAGTAVCFLPRAFLPTFNEGTFPSTRFSIPASLVNLNEIV